MFRHVISAEQFAAFELEQIFQMTDETAMLWKTDKGKEMLRGLLPHRMLIRAFWEVSERTSCSHSVAAARLGMCIPFASDDAGRLSVIKGGSFNHTILTYAFMEPDVLVIRHPDDDAAERAASYIDAEGLNVCLINGGSGKRHHPTQGLLDLYTMRNHCGGINGIHVVMGGDLANSRVCNSLMHMLGLYTGVRISCVAPDMLQIRPEMEAYLQEHGVSVVKTNCPLSVMGDADVVYWTRLQLERIDSQEQRDYLSELQRTSFQIGNEHLAHMPRDSILMHPMPIDDRIQEIRPEVEQDRRVVFLRSQVPNGVQIRTALFRLRFSV